MLDELRALITGEIAGWIAAIVFLVAGSRLSNATGNYLLVAALAISAAAVYRHPLLQRQPQIPHVLWTVAAFGIGGLILYYWLWKPRAALTLTRLRRGMPPRSASSQAA